MAIASPPISPARTIRGNVAVDIADPRFRRGVILFRWVIWAAYIILVAAGVLDIETPAAIGGVLWIATVNAWATWHEFTQERGTIFPLLTTYLDIFNTSVVLLSLHDAKNPVWAVYCVTLVSVAHFLTRRQLMVYLVWISVNYAGVAFGTGLFGHDVSWPYVIAVLIAIQVIGLNASSLAGSQEKIRGAIASVADTDSLTGLPNRRCFHTVFTADFEACRATGEPLALMLIDFDHFKRINDTQGHPAGDDKLREVAGALQGVTRRDDLVARYGGDEFIVVAPRTTREEALQLAHRLRFAAGAASATVSIGVAVFPEAAATDTALIEAADAALYQAKEAGRDCVRAAIAA